MFCTLTPFKPKARTVTLKLTYSDASTKTNDHKHQGWVQDKQLTTLGTASAPLPLLAVLLHPSAVQPAPTSQALGQTQELRESCPQLANLEAKLMAESNQLRTTAEGEPRVREMPPPAWIGVTTSTKGLSTFPPLHEEAELGKINSSGYSPAFLTVWLLVVCRHLTVQLSVSIQAVKLAWFVTAITSTLQCFLCCSLQISAEIKWLLIGFVILKCQQKRFLEQTSIKS